MNLTAVSDNHKVKFVLICFANWQKSAFACAYMLISSYGEMNRLMKMAVAIALMVESWTKPSACIKITCLQCKNEEFQVSAKIFIRRLS